MSSGSPPQQIKEIDLFLPELPIPQDEFILPASTPALQAPAVIDVLPAVSDTDADSLLESLYSDAFAFNLPIIPAEELFEPLQNPYAFHYELSPVQSPWSYLDTSLD